MDLRTTQVFGAACCDLRAVSSARATSFICDEKARARRNTSRVVEDLRVIATAVTSARPDVSIGNRHRVKSTSARTLSVDFSTEICGVGATPHASQVSIQTHVGMESARPSIQTHVGIERARSEIPRLRLPAWWFERAPSGSPPAASAHERR
jgi:hypothetical protein